MKKQLKEKPFTYKSAYSALDFGPLYNGDLLGQKEFHRLYEGTPDYFRAELLDRIVIVSEPVGSKHGQIDVLMSAILAAYCAKTLGVEAFANATVILGEADEVQPDHILCLRPEYGGATTDIVGVKKRKYICGSPELVVEIAHSSFAMDLHMKKERYLKAGVREYLVFCIEPTKLFWFDLPKYKRRAPDEDGVFRSKVFPGLWIHPDSMMRSHYDTMMRFLNRGMRTKEHAAFVKKLASNFRDTFS